MAKCPKCGSKETENYMFMRTMILKCSSCGYDEGTEFDQNSSQKTNQKEKSKYSPYKAGGKYRINKNNK